MPGPEFNSLLQLLNAFPTEEAARKHLELIRWGQPDGSVKPTCPHCGYDEKAYSIEGGKRYKCAGCRKRYTVTVGTIFENTKIGLHKWFAAIYLATSHKKGISSVQLAKDIGVTQKSAWFMAHRIREMLRDKAPMMLVGEVEVDETYIGGKERNKHKSKRHGVTGRSTAAKTPVLGILERGKDGEPSRIRARTIRALDRPTLHGVIRSHVAEGSQLYTDEWGGYRGLSPSYGHEVIRHKSEDYVRGTVDGRTVTTNGIEGAWGQLKRGIVGVFHQVSRKHLDRYVSAFEFRFNTRAMTEGERFNTSLAQCAGRLTYQTLIAGE